MGFGDKLDMAMGIGLIALIGYGVYEVKKKGFLGALGDLFAGDESSKTSVSPITPLTKNPLALNSQGGIDFLNASTNQDKIGITTPIPLFLSGTSLALNPQGGIDFSSAMSIPSSNKTSIDKKKK